ncbi:hypothetical protein KKB71_01400 [Patescibacteria group bacterium]|nr:hypothetical protein [Patescibacteria group bacterium]MBU2219434.1 hypothetical protein [Patescibacteria group bacterium]
MYDPTKPYKKQVLDLIKQTWNTKYVSVKEGIYPVFERKFSYSEVDHTDGIGTKGIYHWQQKTFRNAVLDALAMNLNDLILVGAHPYKLQNHIIIPEDNQEIILEIIENLKEECQKRNIAITGGETSVQDNIKGLDISLTVSGFIKKPQINSPQIEDVIIGVKSSGLHSNGFTKIREVFGDEYRAEFVKPTHIYSDTIPPLLEKYEIHGMMHITGGAFTKLKDNLFNANIRITRNSILKPQEIFYEIYKKGVSDEEMYKIFNCGIGFILSVSPKDKDNILMKIDDAAVIGKVEQGSGQIIIESAFSDRIIKF